MRGYNPILSEIKNLRHDDLLAILGRVLPGEALNLSGGISRDQAMARILDLADTDPRKVTEALPAHQQRKEVERHE